ncbi:MULTISPECIES: GNAT family N-acetyltransferase [Caproicibacterium]|uniref:GNAT family N-acetyltransferase n=1 Tax=Caproicibacterium argilliputei TaxID=3030016 RepID=A0AA97H1M6_9FIRM|nr:GNAT family N-acetyltransferase [Caproicibacterium argilliputei]WOC31472.1 GNAT family N-acetyltransferase [Caproicibacterium argilliputei]
MFVETQRTVLRNFAEKDLQDVWEYSSQKGMEMAGLLPHCSVAESEKALKKDLQNPNKYAIVCRSSDKVIGYLLVKEDSEEHRADTKEFGCVLNSAYRQQGIMTEVILAVLQKLFEQEISYVWACCFQENLASKRMIEKCGFSFRQEGTYFAKPLRKEYKSFEYVWTKENWLRKNM